MTDLLPCPFCGGEASSQHKNMFNEEIVFCWGADDDKCGHRGLCMTKTQWNTRTPPDGMVLVPVQINDDIIDAFRGQIGSYVHSPASMYKAMLEAAKGEG